MWGTLLVRWFGVVWWAGCGIVAVAGEQGLSDRPALPSPKLRTIEGTGTMELRQEPFGKVEGKQVDLYILSNRNGLRVKLMSYGATITAVEVPDRQGKVDNITLYLDTLEDYLKGHPFFGSTVGRYANRIAFGRFTIEGVTYQLATNNNRHHIHGGRKGFDKYVWRAEPIQGEDFVGVAFSHTSPDGDENYPGTLQVKATYILTNQNELRMIFEATTDKPTHVNICNHAYWNLAGAGAGTILDHIMMLNADKYLPVDKELIPLGDPEPVFGTAMDFLTEPKTIGSRIHQVPGGGYDHCYVLRKDAPGKMSLAARVVEPKSGRVMEVYTTQPGVQFYTGNFLDGSLRAGRHNYPKHAGFCLETQHFPDSPNRPSYPSTLLRPGQTYREETIHKFSLLAE
ncbi:MAG: galactose mutarotase [Thermoguttaceae bacterium]|nr:galactose mutarotase [Thermoguttaceae bacterium]MDW8039387.1 aldose epimerase family protein [Thermoguttaceae bacterium]